MQKIHASGVKKARKLEGLLGSRYDGKALATPQPEEQARLPYPGQKPQNGGLQDSGFTAAAEALLREGFFLKDD
jgi:hypothetical protein